MNPPGEVLVDPSPAQVRAVVRDHAAASRDDAAARTAAHDLELAVTEVLANAAEHGVPPVEVVVATVAGRLEVTVRERGPGPRGVASRPLDPDAERGRGRWLAHRSAEVRERSTPDGHEIRLTAVPRRRGPTGAHD